MPTGAESLHLVWAILFCVVPIAAGYRFARRFSPPLSAIPEALLLSFLAQYLSVMLAGFLGILTLPVPTCFAALICATMFILGRRSAAELLEPLDRIIVVASFCFLIGFLGAFIYNQRFLPPLSTDALAYHLPAAVQWLQHRRIDLLQTWFFNPANTYSPLAGSVFMAWLMAPLGNDALARFVQAGPFILLFFALIDLARESRAQPALAALVALAAMISRPFIAQTTLANDDLFVAAFFTTIVANLSPARLRHPRAPMRIGVALGLLLATKYTALLSAAALILACDAPFRAGWRLRHFLRAAVWTLLLPAPWFIRNWMLFGNPLFPAAIHLLHLPGMFAPTRSIQLSSASGIWAALSAGYFAMPPMIWAALAIAWLLALIRAGASLLRDPFIRLVLLGPPVGIALFAFFSPYPEVRFILPSIVLLFAAVPIALSGRLEPLVLILLGMSLATSFAAEHRSEITQFALVGTAAAILGLGLWRLDVDRLGLWRGIPCVTAAALAVALFFALTAWSGYLADYRQTTDPCWILRYGDQGDLWSELDAQAPADATVAYANQFMIYPLYGFDHTRRVIYAPLQRGLRLQDLQLPPRLSGEQISAAATAAANRTVDRAAWLQNLQSAGAQYLIVQSGNNVPEIWLANQDPQHFHPIFQNFTGAIYRITQ